MSATSELWPYLVLVLVGFLPTEVWRMLGLVAARGIDEESELLIWVRAVAVAVLAGVIAKLVVLPPGALATVPLAVRLAAIAAGFAAFLLVRRSVLAGVAVGEIVLVVGAMLVGR
ncbi:MAG: AzlD domain-containing protein [Xanthobacteraceae bacterium]|jgi:Branched-chain amino acid transport protein (AzlD)